MNHVKKLKSLIDKHEFRAAEQFADKLDIMEQLVSILSHPRYTKHMSALCKYYKGEAGNMPLGLVQVFRQRYLSFVLATSVDGQAELRLLGDKTLLARFAERLFHSRKVDASLSLIHRHSLQPYICSYALRDAMDGEYRHVNNAYLTHDGFCELTRPGGERGE